jgi:hypothetical protein
MEEVRKPSARQASFPTRTGFRFASTTRRPSASRAPAIDQAQPGAALAEADSAIFAGHVVVVRQVLALGLSASRAHAFVAAFSPSLAGSRLFLVSLSGAFGLLGPVAPLPAQAVLEVFLVLAHVPA